MVRPTSPSPMRTIESGRPCQDPSAAEASRTSVTMLRIGRLSVMSEPAETPSSRPRQTNAAPSANVAAQIAQTSRIAMRKEISERIADDDRGDHEQTRDEKRAVPGAWRLGDRASSREVVAIPGERADEPEGRRPGEDAGRSGAARAAPVGMPTTRRTGTGAMKTLKKGLRTAVGAPRTAPRK